jgi:putative membrane protein insertion efficiency factor
VKIVRLPFLAALRLYKFFISPMLPAACRFYPSCSDYAFTAIQKHGVIAGVALAARRLVRCNPWNPGGLDPVPEPHRK